MTRHDEIRDEILRRADIAEHAERAGFRRRGRAWFCGFHENTRTPSASIKGNRVLCFSACDRSWDAIDLTMRRLGLDYIGALRVLAQEYAIPFDDRQFTPAERAGWGRRRRAAERVARPLAHDAWCWWNARLADLLDLKASAVTAQGIDVGVLRFAAPEVRRLEKLSPDGVLREFLQFRDGNPEVCAGLVRADRAWDAACQAGVEAVLARIAQDQEGAKNAA